MNNHLNDLSYKVIGAAIEVHQQLGGPGLLEDIYEKALCHEFKLIGLNFKTQVIVPVMYKNEEIKHPLCLDILVEDNLIIEVKATEENLEIHRAQLLTYLRLKHLKLGLLINFGKSCVRDGISRIVNKF